MAVSYVPRSTLRGLFHQLARYGRGRIRLLRKHPDTFSLSCLIPLVFVIALLAGAAAGLVWAQAAMAIGAVLAVYAALVLSTSLAIAARQRSPAMFLWLPLIFVTIHIASGTGMLLELGSNALRGTRQVPAGTP